MTVKPLVLLRAATKVAGLFALAVPHAAYARSITHDVPPSVLIAYCATQPIDSETRASFTGTDGKVLTGTVECDAHDLQELAAGGNDDVPGIGDDDGTPDQGGGNDDDGPEDANDDHGGDDSEDESGDDHGNHSGDDSSGDSSDDSSDDSDESEDESGDDNSGHGGDDH